MSNRMSDSNDYLQASCIFCRSVDEAVLQLIGMTLCDTSERSATIDPETSNQAASQHLHSDSIYANGLSLIESDLHPAICEAMPMIELARGTDVHVSKFPA